MYGCRYQRGHVQAKEIRRGPLRMSRLWGQETAQRGEGRTYPCQRFKSEIVPLDRFDLMATCKASIAVHHKRHMLWDRTLPQRADEQLPYMHYGPFDRR